MVAAAIVGSAVVGAVGSSMAADAQGEAAESAANAQSQSSAASIAEQRRQFNELNTMMQPFREAGTRALGMQGDLIGLNGAGSQQAAIEQLKQSPQFQALLQQGETSILQNASATGGLRGGNTQAALAQFSPQLLAQTIEAQYGRLGGITSLGQNAAALTGNAGMNSANSISALLQSQGAAQAGAALAGGRAQSQMISGITGGIGQVLGGMGGGFGGFGSPAPAAAAPAAPVGSYGGYYQNLDYF